MLKFISNFLDYILRFPHKIRYKYYASIYGRNLNEFFRGEGTKVYGGGGFSVGLQSYCGVNCGFCTVNDSRIVIGNNVSISHNVRIYTSNRDPLDIINRRSPVTNIVGDVVIGDNVWIGANVIITQNVTIGDNVVIGANSVVSKSVSSNQVVAGAPLRVIKSL
jgi:acetyltransferase-like isoleucine patch superfamily enzyme